LATISGKGTVPASVAWAASVMVRVYIRINLMGYRSAANRSYTASRAAGCGGGGEPAKRQR
jgi:hypothetical protein